MQPGNYGYYEQHPLPKDDSVLQESYGPILAACPNAEFVKDDNNVYRFRRKCLANWLCDHTNLTELRLAYLRGQVPRDEYMQFYQDIGYSLSGFWDVFEKEIAEMSGTELESDDL